MPVPRISWLVDQAQGERVLDIGFAGTKGYPAVHKLIREENRGSFVAGVDINSKLVLEHKVPNSSVADAYQLPFQAGSFDIVVLGEVVEHVYEPRLMLKEIHRVLTAHGKLVLTTPSPYDLWNWLKYWLLSYTPASRENYRKFLESPDHVIFWEPLSLCNMLHDCGFEVTILTTRHHTIPYIGRLLRRTIVLDPQFWPFERLGYYLCLVARRM